MFWGTPSFFWGQKKYHDTFRKFHKTPTHPSGTFRVMFHQKSTCTPPPPPGIGLNIQYLKSQLLGDFRGLTFQKRL